MKALIPNVEISTPMPRPIPAESSGLPESSLKNKLELIQHRKPLGAPLPGTPIGLKLWHSVAQILK